MSDRHTDNELRARRTVSSYVLAMREIGTEDHWFLSGDPLEGFRPEIKTAKRYIDIDEVKVEWDNLIESIEDEDGPGVREGNAMLIGDHYYEVMQLEEQL